ncbi:MULTISPECIES: hypothetical protein [unclassified Levilactobacillus]|uniref:hypothetical protein n=1 Tax=unclassified Levilactobacillus TaxID=2767918 RepID=UPI002FF0D35E
MMLVYNRLYASQNRRVNSFKELQKLVVSRCAKIGDPIRSIRAITHGASQRGSKAYPTYEFEAIHEKKLIDGRLYREKVVFEVIKNE